MINTRAELIEKQPKIIELYRSNEYTLRQIGKLLSTSQKFIFKTLNEFKIKRKVFTSKWSSEEINWLKNNYTKLGPEECSKILGKKATAISYKGKILGLKYEHPDIQVDMENFYNIRMPEVAYLLGIFYADGCIRNSLRSDNTMSLTSKTSDAITIYDSIMKTGKWKFYSYKRATGSISYFKLNSRKLITFLRENGYEEKSTRSADKILSKIPEHLKHYWFRGFLDGDGFIRSRVGTGCELGFAGDIRQDWHFMEKLCERLNIGYKITKNEYKLKNSKIYHGSTLYVYGAINSMIILNYIYKNREDDKIGLYRKYEKYLSIVNNLKNKVAKTSNIQKFKNKNNFVYRVCICEDGIRTIKTLNSEMEALKFKYETISNRKTWEYRIRELINYWIFIVKFDTAPREVQLSELFPHTNNLT